MKKMHLQYRPYEPGKPSVPPFVANPIKQVILGRPLLAAPLARLSKQQHLANWHKWPKDSPYKAACHPVGNEFISLFWRRLPLGTPTIQPINLNWAREPRMPSAVECNMLFILLTLAQEENPVDLQSLQLLMPYFNMNARDARTSYGTGLLTGDTMRYTLRMWQILEVRWSEFDLNLPPAIEEIYVHEPIRRTYRQKLSVRVNQEWIDMCRDGYRIPFPLPSTAPSQNIVLRTIHDGSTDNIPVSLFHAITTASKHNGSMLQKAETVAKFPLEVWDNVSKWYQKHGGNLELIRGAPYYRKGRLAPSDIFNIRVDLPRGTKIPKRKNIRQAKEVLIRRVKPKRASTDSTF